MLIDGFTVAAQAINFLILVWLLKRFLYGPILAAIDDREQGIKERLAQAEAQQVAAQAAEQVATKRSSDLDQQRDGLLKQARQDAHQEGARLLEQARRDADALGHERLEALHVEEVALNASLAARARKEAFGAARQILASLGGVSIEARIVDQFLSRLSGLGQQERSTLAGKLGATGAVTIRSASELAPEQREDLRLAFRSLLGSSSGDPGFEINPELLGGFEVVSNGQKLSWTVSNYLGALEVTAQALPKPATVMVTP